MKKSLLILTLILVMVTAVSLTACGNTPLQSVLVAPWDEYEEVATYNVEHKVGDNVETGVMKVSYKKVNKTSIDVTLPIATEHITPNYKADEFYGVIVTTDLTMNNGEYKHSVIVTDKQLRAKYSIAKSHFIDKNTDGKYEDLEVEYKYEAEKCTYNVKGTIDKTGEIKYKQFNQVAYFDNAFYIAITRTFGPMDRQASLSFLTPSFRDEKMMKRVGATTLQKVEIAPNEALDASKFVHQEGKEDKSTVTCLRSSIASGETMPGTGTPINYYISAIPYKLDDNRVVKNVLLKFVEHDVTYTLTDIDLVKVA